MMKIMIKIHLTEIGEKLNGVIELKNDLKKEDVAFVIANIVANIAYEASKNIQLKNISWAYKILEDKK